MLSEQEKKIIQNELEIRGVKSVVLIGSRSTGDFVKEGSDYDLYVITPAWVVPFIYKTVKEKEKILEKKLGNNVSIAPLTMWRVRRGKDLLLLKTKKQGTTIAGKDYLSLINMENLKDVHPDELFSYLFSSIYFLMEYFHPVKNQCGKMENFNYNVSKSMMYCIEVQLYVKGIYEKKKKNIFMNTKDLPGSNNKLLDGIDIAKKIMEGDTSLCIDEPNKLWFLAR
ncbi:MAG: nucleotidyltransferase domain-containing protein, partial [Bacteroidales bacterium]|nr:nucleotidyltransferase domain-containing protein [Bacteroidales bacterium]